MSVVTYEGEPALNTQPVQLSHLFYRPGNSASPEKSAAGTRVAASAGLNRSHWDECLRLAPLLPPTNGPGLGFYRGQVVDFVLAHAYQDEAGQPMVHYVLLGADQARRIAGRPALIAAMLAEATGISVGTDGVIPALDWAPPIDPTVDEQSNDLSTFMFQVHDDRRVVESLLSALILGRQIAILNAPEAIDTRLAFVQGLLALLPIPARYGVTYVSHTVLRGGAVQIMFVDGDVVPEGVVTYDWAAASFTGELGEEAYSRFIVQQLRLDPGVAVEQMMALARTAAWRLRRGETLAEALGWSARRVALDAAVTEGQPADITQVATALREDESLTGDLRVRYVRHVLAFMLALQEFDHAVLVGRLVEAHEDIAASVAAMLDSAIEDGKQAAVFALLEAWVAEPDCPQGSTWQRRAQQAALKQLRTLSEQGDGAAAVAFLDRAQKISRQPLTRSAVGAMLEAVLPLAVSSPVLAERVVLMAAEYLDGARFRTLVQRENLATQLPAAFGEMLAHFQPGLPTAAPLGVMVAGANVFGEEHAPLLLMRLTEWVLTLDRPDLIDPQVLAGLVALAQGPLKDRFADTMRQAVNVVGGSSMLTLLEVPGPRLLAEILLLLGDYREVAALLERVSDTLYRGEARREFGPWIYQIFSETALDNAAVVDAVGMIARQGLKPGPAVHAYNGALSGREADPALVPLMEGLATRLINDELLVPVVGYSMALRLVQHYAQKRDAEQTVSLAAVITNSLGGAEQGLHVVGRLWSMLNWNNEVQEAALELLRRYVRQVPVEKAGALPELMGRRLGNQVGQMISATYTMNIITDGHGLEGLAAELRTVTMLLLDLVSTYEQETKPTIHRLTSDLDALTGGADDAMLDQIGADLLAIARLVWDIGGQDIRGRKPAATGTLLANAAAPHSGLEALVWLSGYLKEGAVQEPEIQREAMQHLLGGRSLSMLRDDLHVTRSLLERLQAAFTKESSRLEVEAFAADIESLWKGMRLYDQRQLGDNLAADAQAIPFLVRYIAEKGSPRALEQGGLGRNLERARREPRSVMEALRLLYGYFMRQF